MSRFFRQLAWRLVLLGLALSLGCGGPRGPRPLPATVPSDSLPQTDVVPHTQGDLTPGRNYVYCATFQLAWDELQSQVLKQPVALQGDPALAKILNSQSQPNIKLDPESYLARAGIVNERFLSELRREVNQKFPTAAIKIPAADPQDILAFAALIKSLPFAAAFDPLKQPIAFRHAGGTTKVAGFGFRGDLKSGMQRTERLLDQVDVLDYVSDDDFILRLKPSSADDQLILAKLPRPKTLVAAIEQAKTRTKVVGRAASRLAADETLAVPMVVLGVEKRFRELEGLAIENAPWNEQGYYLDVARQDIRFRLDERGAELSSTAEVHAKSAVFPAPERPRSFVLDAPFLLMLERNHLAAPYLAIWIETPELLIQSDR